MSDQERLKAFVELSALLTGYPASELGNSARNLHRMYEAFLKETVPKPFASLIARYLELKNDGKSDEEIGNFLVNEYPYKDENGNEVYLASLIIIMWYTGGWYPSGSSFAGTVINMQTYQGGLAWKTIGAPASGTSGFQFGYWAKPPVGMENIK